MSNDPFGLHEHRCSSLDCDARWDCSRPDCDASSSFDNFCGTCELDQQDDYWSQQEALEEGT